MEKIKLALITIVTLSLLGLLGYWSINTIQSGTDHVKDQKIKQLQKDNEDLKNQLENLKNEASLPKPPMQTTPNNTNDPGIVIYEHQDLIDQLQKMVDGKVALKSKSRGAYVGTVQEFLNLYNDTTDNVDNDYGAGTVTKVSAFQKALGLSADGQAGVGTFKKMIDWLKEQG